METTILYWGIYGSYVVDEVDLFPARIGFSLGSAVFGPCFRERLGRAFSGQAFQKSSLGFRV